MKKFIFNLIKFSFILLIIPLGIFIIDPYNYFEHPFKMDIDRMELFRRNNVANWAMVEVNKIDDDIKSNIETCVIGDSRSRLMISSGHIGGWTKRICGTKLDVLDLSFGGANLDESFSLLNNQINKFNSLKTIIVSVSVDRLLVQNHDINRISSSYFDNYTAGIKYLTDINLLTNIIENKSEILKNRTETKKDTLKKEKKISIKNQNDQIRKNKIDPEKIKKRKRIVIFKKERFHKKLKHPDKPKESNANDEKVRENILRTYNKVNRSQFNRNLEILKNQLSALDDQYEIIIIIPAYDNILYDLIIENHRNYYKYYVSSIKKLPYTVINLQDRSNEFVFPDPIHGNYENGTLIYKINNELETLLELN